MVVFFFFQAEDGIRDVAVTGVQTCALPISSSFASDFQMAVSPKTSLNQRRNASALTSLLNRRFRLLPNSLEAQPRWVSRICPTFIREGTPSGFKTISTGVPSGR